MSRELANLLASRFIARSDVKALQYRNNAGKIVYAPVREKFTREDLEAHIAGTKTFGHYVLDQESKCKIICFDIDLKDKGFLPTIFDENGPSGYVEVDDLRAAWHQRNHPARTYMKGQFHTAAHLVARKSFDLLGSICDVTVSYSGNKGVHVYAMTRPNEPKLSAAKARTGADLVLDQIKIVQDESRNGSGIFYGFKDKDPESGYPNLSIEVFPKQDSIDPEGLGNLVRLPLGKNLKHTDPTFFVDMASSLSSLNPIDPIRALTPGYNMWQTPEEAASVQSTGSTSTSPA